MEKWIKMFKDGEEKLVHPGNVRNHQRFGWFIAEESQPVAEAITVEEPAAGAENASAAVDDQAQAKALTQLSGSMLKAIKPSSAQAKAFAILEVSIVDEFGKPREVETVAVETMEGLSKIADLPELGRLAVTLFGKSAGFIVSKFEKVD